MALVDSDLILTEKRSKRTSYGMEIMGNRNKHRKKKKSKMNGETSWDLIHYERMHCTQVNPTIFPRPNPRLAKSRLLHTTVGTLDHHIVRMPNGRLLQEGIPSCPGNGDSGDSSCLSNIYPPATIKDEQDKICYAMRVQLTCCSIASCTLAITSYHLYDDLRWLAPIIVALAMHTEDR